MKQIVEHFEHNETGHIVCRLAMGTYQGMFGAEAVVIFCPDDNGDSVMCMPYNQFAKEYHSLGYAENSLGRDKYEQGLS